MEYEVVGSTPPDHDPHYTGRALRPPPTCCFVWGTVWGERSPALLQICVYLHLYYTSLHPYTQCPAFYTAEPRCAHTYAHTYAHTGRYCLDPPCATVFGAQRREGVLKFARALYTTTSTSAIARTTNICAASSAYQIPRYIYMRRTSGTKCIYMQACRSFSWIWSVYESSVRAYLKVQIRSPGRNETSSYLV